MHFLKQKGFDKPNHSSLARNYVKPYPQQSLQLELPEACQLSGPDLSQAIANFNASHKPILKSLWPTIASSLSSSDLDSLCALRGRIHNSFEGAWGDVCEYAEMPSDGTRDLSRSSLGASFNVPGSNFSQSVLDNLAKISIQIGEQIQC
jgi:hypothetical protein